MDMRRLWTLDEIRLAIGLYVQIPFGKIDRKNPQVIALSTEVGRTPGAVALKLANLASLDQTISRKGMQNASQLDRTAWDEFFASLIAASRALPDPPQFAPALTEEAGIFIANGLALDRFGIAKQRSRQDLFRRMVITAYDGRCALTGIDQGELLIAGHIKPWALDIDRRLDPTNGICLNRLHDRAFDEGLITFEDDGRIRFSKHLKPASLAKLESLCPDNKLRAPRRFLPDKELLQFHRDVIFEVQKPA